MTGILFSHADEDGDKIEIAVDEEELPRVFVWIARHGGMDVVSAYVPAHKWPEFCRTGYRAAGFEAPDLPEIPDQSEIEALARDLQNARHCADGTFADQARWLITEGRWQRKDGAR